MASSSEIKMMKEYRDAGFRLKGKFPFESKTLFVKRLVFVLSSLALLLLFLPFAKAGLLAFVFALAVIDAQEKIKALSKTKQVLFMGAMGFIGIVFISLFFSLTQTVSQAINSISDTASFAETKTKISELFAPSIALLKDTVAVVLGPFDSSKYIETKLASSANHLIDSTFSWFLGWLIEIPNHFLQICFFLFMVVFLVKNMESKKVYQFLLNLEINGNTLKFLIGAANRSGFNAVVITLLTAFAQAVVLTLGSALIGIKVWPVVFITTFISSMLPVVGVLPVAAFCVIYAAADMSGTSALVMAFFGVAASLIDNILRPILISGDESINPVLSFFALVGSLFVFGFAGLFLGPFILVFTTMIFKRYIRTV